MKARLRPLVVVLIGTITTGCNTLSRTVDIRSNASRLPPSPLPNYRAGDRIHYKDGHNEYVTKVTEQKIQWERSSTRRYTTWRNFMLPHVSSGSRRYLGNENIDKAVSPDILWPLKVGNTARFSSRKYNTAKASNTTKISLRFWNCQVSGTANVQVLAGTFDTYRVECFRHNELNKPSRHFVWYYAPELQHPIVKVEYRKSGKFPPKVEEVLALERGLNWLAEDERNSLREKLNKVLEYHPSGKPGSWKSRDGGTRVTIIPTNSLRSDSGNYCRNYLQKISYGKLKQTAAGLMCRIEKEHWSIPTKAWKYGNLDLFPMLNILNL